MNGGAYYYLVSNATGTKIKIEKGYDYGHDIENRRFEAGNYFQHESQAEQCKIRLANFLKNFKK